MESTLFLCFRGVDMPDTEEEKINDIISGRVYLKLLAKHDLQFGMLWDEYKESILSTKTPAQSMKNWRYISTVLDDHGLEIGAEVMFSIISGQEPTAVQLATEIRGIMDAQGDRAALRRVGPPVPVRQRVNPFLGTPIGAPTAAGSSLKEGTLTGAGGGKSGIAAQTVNPTKLYVQDPNRFMRKRTFFVEQIEKLREKELRVQRLKEKKEREEAQRRLEAQRKNESLEVQKAEEQFINETLLLHRADPEKMEQRKKRTELLNKLEVLESAFTSDQRKMLRLRHQMDQPSTPRGGSPDRDRKSPRRSSPKRMSSPKRLRAVTSIPFSKPPPKKSSQPEPRKWV